MKQEVEAAMDWDEDENIKEASEKDPTIEAEEESEEEEHDKDASKTVEKSS